MPVLHFPDILSKKDGHTVRVSTQDYAALVVCYPGIKADLISKRLIEGYGSEVGAWADAIREVAEFSAGQSRKTYTFRPAPAHASAIENVASEFARRCPGKAAPSVQLVMMGLFRWRARSLLQPSEASVSSSLIFETPLVTGHLSHVASEKRQIPEMQGREPPDSVSVEPRGAVSQRADIESGCGWLRLRWPAIVVMILMTSLVVMNLFWEAKNRADSALFEVNQLREEIGRPVRASETERLRSERERRALADAVSRQGVDIQKLIAETQGLRAEIQALKNQGHPSVRTSRP